jgi:hypothetical protein
MALYELGCSFWVSIPYLILNSFYGIRSQGDLTQGFKQNMYILPMEDLPPLGLYLGTGKIVLQKKKKEMR